MTTTPLPGTAVVRVSRGNFRPGPICRGPVMTVATGRSLIPAIEEAARPHQLLRRRVPRRLDGARQHLGIRRKGQADQRSRK